MNETCCNHPEMNAIGICRYCDRSLCPLCLTEATGYYHCDNDDACMAWQEKKVASNSTASVENPELHLSEPCSSAHLEEADRLIQSAHIYAIGTYESMLNEYPQLEAVADSNLLSLWDHLITIASVGTAFMEIVDTVPEKDQRGICNAVQKELNDWHSDAYMVMADFILFSKKLVDSGVEPPDAIGGWIWANLGKHEQANKALQELASSLELVRPVGVSILISFHNWWKQS